MAIVPKVDRYYSLRYLCKNNVDVLLSQSSSNAGPRSIAERNHGKGMRPALYPLLWIPAVRNEFIRLLKVFLKPACHLILGHDHSLKL